MGVPQLTSGLGIALAVAVATVRCFEEGGKLLDIQAPETGFQK